MVVGLREQRKQRTRRALAEAALRLFDAQGYDATTVAEIAAAAELSPATFFNYFPSKEEVVFADRLVNAGVLARALEERAPGEPPAEVLLRAVGQALESPAWSVTPGGDLVPVRARLIASVPVLRARALLEIAALQAEWSAALVAAYPDDLDGTGADILTGALIGAVIAVAGQALRAGATGEPLPDLVLRAAAAVLAARPS
ncbi:TetR family transcriptional regulator [Nonomuraea terrae]|uniref:TetR family transcriptional regulator n=1 Tax=Nonomuraea terrae TaxID=2530383 RepID=A0A4R4Z9E7_9ACTN|nr:TetR family transcriptional regulator [Nonomuraea terrae]TDD54961.1 TetR family transcriptional regulator [Nonomuraea terrae]